jgi:tetratricopeptide (TPR) repeat protein
VKNWHKNVILAAAILAFGAARMPFEAKVAKELQAANLAPPKLQIGTGERIGQTSTAVALGGLRTLVATFINLKAFTYFQEQKWDQLAETFDTIVDLAPRTPYYWDAGSSHLAYDAASYYLSQSTLPPLRRKEAWRASIQQGRAFLERGIRNNPDDWNLLAKLGTILSDSNKFTAFPDQNQAFTDAAAAFRRAAATGNALPYVKRAELWSLARVKGKEKEALDLAHTLYATPANRVPVLLQLMFVLEAHENPQMDTTKRALEIFGSPEKAYDALTLLWQRSKERYPVYGVAATLESLEKILQIAPDKSILNQPLAPPGDMDRFFNQ